MNMVFGPGFQCPLTCNMQMQINGVLEPKVYRVGGV
jgi:hypothetical protein